MALGRRQPQEQELWVTTQSLPRSPGHPFYEALNRVLREADFDRWVEDLCAPHYKEGGRPSIPPGTYFRMLFVGYFEGIESQRGIVWRCSDSLALREFLGFGLSDAVPDHSSLTKIRQRFPLVVYQEVFRFVLELASTHGLLKGKTLGVDSTMLEANAAMKSIVRRDGGETWEAYVRSLMDDDEKKPPTEGERRRFDRKRKRGGKGKGRKRVSNEVWQSPSDPDAKIMRMKDGTTRLAYKAEHAVDLDTELVVAAVVLPANVADSASLCGSVSTAQANLEAIGAECRFEEVVADKGYHKLSTLVELRDEGLRTYIPKQKIGNLKHRRWTDKPEGSEETYRANHRRTHGERGKRLQRTRSERCERTFAHVCATGAGRKAMVKGLEEVSKRHLLGVAARNLGLLLRLLVGVGTPRALQAAQALLAAWIAWATHVGTEILGALRVAQDHQADLVSQPGLTWRFSTGC